MGNRFCSKELIERLSSNTLRDELEKHGPKRCARFWFQMGGQFNLDYIKTGSLESLNHALTFSQRALDKVSHSPDLHEDAVRYAVILAQLWQDKTKVTQDIIDEDHYIQCVKLKIDLIENGSLHDEAVGELGCAYFSRFGLRHDQCDLHRAIEVLEKHVVSREATYPNATLSLGCALHHRYLLSPDISDLKRALDLQRKALDSTKLDNPSRVWGSLNLVKSTFILYEKEPSEEVCTSLVKAAKEALATGPVNEECATWLNIVLRDAAAGNYFRRPQPFAEISDAVALIDRGQCSSRINFHGHDDALGDDLKKLIILDQGADSFQYTELMNSNTYMRLLELESGKSQDSIRCNIFEVLQSSTPLYEALSYVWGDANNLTSILVNGAPFSVTKNLFEALHRLRHQKETRKLWIDAICINQRNLDEKKDQIDLMGQIYKKANHVILWLGEPCQSNFYKTEQDSTEPDFQDVETLEQASMVKTVAIASLATTSSSVTDQDKYADRLSSKDSAEAARAILRDYGTPENAQAVLNDALDETRHVLYGAKPAVMIRKGHLSSELYEVFQNVIEGLDKYGQIEIQLQDHRVQSLKGPALDIYDWTRDDQIPSFLEAPLLPDEWPILAAFYLIHEFAAGKHFDKLPFFRQDEAIMYSSSQAWIKAASALRDILDLAYWSRAWIVQEVVLASDSSLYIGPHVMPFSTLVKASNFYSYHFLRCCGKWGNEAYQKQFSWWTTIHNAFQKIRALSQLRDAHLETSAHLPPPKLDLLQLLKASIGRYNATDPRDHIYGLLSLGQNDHSEMMKADYTLSVAAVFAKVAFCIIHHERSLHLLVFNELGCSTDLALPSWTPSWTPKGADFCSEPYYYHLFDTSKGAEPLTSLQGGLCLSFETIKVDVISKTTATMTLPWKHPKDLLRLLDEWRQFAGLGEPKESSEGDESRLNGTKERFWRTLFADTIKLGSEDQELSPRERRIKGMDLKKIYHWWQWLRETPKTFNGTEWNDLRSVNDAHGNGLITNSFWEATNMRKLFTTPRGLLGTGNASLDHPLHHHMEVKVGDEIHAALGGRIPFVLRPVVEPISRALSQEELLPSAASRRCHHDSAQVYQLIGTCYVHGIMDGETMNDITLQKAKIFIH